MEEKQSPQEFIYSHTDDIERLIGAFFSRKVHEASICKQPIEDLKQECFAEILKTANKYDSERSSLSNWVYIVCGTVISHHLQRSRTQRRHGEFTQVSLDGIVIGNEKSDLTYLDTIDSGENVEREVQVRQLESYLKNTFYDSGTKDGYIVKRLMLGAKAIQIADELGISRQALSINLKRIRSTIYRDCKQMGVVFPPEYEELYNHKNNEKVDQSLGSLFGIVLPRVKSKNYPDLLKITLCQSLEQSYPNSLNEYPIGLLYDIAQSKNINEILLKYNLTELQLYKNITIHRSLLIKSLEENGVAFMDLRKQPNKKKTSDGATTPPQTQNE